MIIDSGKIKYILLSLVSRFGPINYRWIPPLPLPEGAFALYSWSSSSPPPLLDLSLLPNSVSKNKTTPQRNSLLYTSVAVTNGRNSRDRAILSSWQLQAKGTYVLTFPD